MPKTTKKQEKKNDDKVGYQDIIWVMDNLDAQQLAMHDTNPLDDTAIIEGLDKMRDSGFSIAIKHDDYNDCVLVTAKCEYTAMLNAGLAISARGNDLGDCLSILCFKFFVVAEGDLRPFADKKPKGVRG